MFAIAKRALLDRKWTIVAFLASGVFFAWVYVATYPSLQATQAAVADFVKNLPPALNKAFGLDPSTFSTFNGYVAGKQFSLLWPMLLTALLAGLSANFVAAEVEKGTIELALAQPISRMRIYWAKVLAGVMANLLYIIFSVFSYIPIAAAAKIDFNKTSYILLSEVGFILGLAVFGIGMFFSSVVSEKGKALFLTVAVFIAMYVLYIASLLNTDLDKFKYISFLYYYDYSSILTTTKVFAATWPVLAGSFGFFALAGLIWFNKRDIVT
jgi:ABC-2 type transport system permease protein